MRKQNVNCGNGVTGAVFVNGQLTDSIAIASNDGKGVNRSVEVSVNSGDFIDLVHTPMGEGRQAMQTDAMEPSCQPS